MAKGSGGTRGASGGAGGGMKPRASLWSGSKEVKSAANHVFWSAATDRTDMKGASDAEKKANWNKSYNNLIKALSHVEKHGTDFEKSVAATIKKGLRKYNEKAFKVGYVSFKQSQIIGKSLAETHFKIN
jgi:hypothetical protein